MDVDDENETRGMRLRRKGGLKEEREGCTKCPVCTPALLYDHDYDDHHDHVMHFDRTDQDRPTETRRDQARPGQIRADLEYLDYLEYLEYLEYQEYPEYLEYSDYLEYLERGQFRNF